MSKPELHLEIAHVLFMDIVGYSKLLVDEQHELLQHLNEIVRSTEQSRSAEARNELIRLPTGDGMALVFLINPEAPVQCALEITEGLKIFPELRLRMGVHSGPVNRISDVNQRVNLAGAGINMAQRVMDCGDAGHILLSKRAADDLAQYRHWQSHLHDLGECEVKHTVRIHVVNLYTQELGNPAVPEKFQDAAAAALPAPLQVPVVAAKGERIPWAAIAAVFLLIAAVLAGVLFFSHRSARRQTNAPATPAPSDPARSAIPAKSIAVLPFENLSSDRENSYFSDGVQDEILTDLAKIADLKVISRTSVMQYKTGGARKLREIGKELGVANLLEGSVQRANGKVRVNAQLIDARTDTHLWANSYDRDLADVFAIQSEIAKAIVEQLRAKISANEKGDRAATHRQSRGLRSLQPRDSADRHQCFRRRLWGQTLASCTVTRPGDRQGSALHPCLLRFAGVHDFAYFSGFDHTSARLGLAEKAVQSALQLRPDGGEAHLAQAQHFYQGYLAFDRARAELALARRTLPNDPRIFELAGYILRRQGHQQEGLENLQRARELDPRNFASLQQIALSYDALHRYEMAEVLDRALAIVPDDVDTRVTRAQVPLTGKRTRGRCM